MAVMYYLLEIIWTRLTYKYEVCSSVFGDDYDFEPMHKFIDCKVGTEDGKFGWMYKYSPFTANVLNSTNRKKLPWEPKFLNDKQFAVIVELCIYEVIDIGPKSDFRKGMLDSKENPDIFLNELMATGLVYVRDNELRMLIDVCATMILPDGRCCAGENRSGEFSNWFATYLESRN